MSGHRPRGPGPGSPGLAALLEDIVGNAQLVEAWLADAAGEDGRIVARTRGTFDSEDAATAAADSLVAALAQDAPGRVLASTRRSQLDGDVSRGIVELRIEG